MLERMSVTLGRGRSWMLLIGLMSHWHSLMSESYWLYPDSSRLSAPLYCTHIPSHILVHALWSRCTCSVLHMHDACTFPCSAQLQVLPWLVLRLRGGEVILQEALQVLKGGPLLGLFSPAGQHQVMQGFRALCWARHPVATLHLV